MKKPKLILLLLSLFLLTGCFGSGGTVTRNIRVIVQAEVAGEIVEGSAVMGIRWVPDGDRMHIKSNAEAVILDLNGRGTVYVLNAFMTNNGLSNGSYWPFHVLRTFGMKANGKKTDFPKLRSLEGRFPLDPILGHPPQLPVMVAFENEAKRETMFQVKPDAFSEVFGPDVKFVGMWFEFTEDKPTEFLPPRLPIALTPNESFYSAFPKIGSDGNRIPSRDYAFPQKFSKSMFFKKEY